jgi:catechol 2,3-dioxygenase-like lactoylglutathione lyase family enzyme
MRVLGLHHAGVHVTDLEQSVAFYQALFGLRPVHQLRLGNERIVFLDAGGGSIELIADGSGARPTGSVDHLALEVQDLDDWLVWLREHGVRLLDEVAIEVPELGVRILFCLGPDDERIELLERATGAPAS